MILVTPLDVLSCSFKHMLLFMMTSLITPTYAVDNLAGSDNQRCEPLARKKKEEIMIIHLGIYIGL